MRAALVKVALVKLDDFGIAPVVQFSKTSLGRSHRSSLGRRWLYPRHRMTGAGRFVALVGFALDQFGPFAQHALARFEQLGLVVNAHDFRRGRGCDVIENAIDDGDVRAKDFASERAERRAQIVNRPVRHDGDCPALCFGSFEAVFVDNPVKATLCFRIA